MTRLLLLLALVVLNTSLFAQFDQTEVAWADSAVQWVRDSIDEDVNEAVLITDSAARIYNRAGLNCKYLDTKILYASSLKDIGALDSALAVLIDVENEFSDACDSTTLFQAYVTYTNLFLSLDELDRLDSLSQYAMSIWNDNWENFDLKMAILNNWSISQAYQGNLKEAERIFRQLNQESVRYDLPNYETKSLVNLGSLKGMTGDIDSAYFYLDQAAKRALKEGDNDNYISILINLANVEREREKYTQAQALLDSAGVIAARTNNLDFLGMVQLAQSETHASAKEFESAYSHLQLFNGTREKLLNEERIRVVSDMQEKYESEKKTREIQDLKIDNLDAELRNEQVTRSRNLFMFGGLFIVLLAIGLLASLRHVRRSRIAIQKEKDISESLLLNILPEKVAEELKAKGKAQAQLIEHVSVIFTDFKDFTSMSEDLSPQDLVHDLNTCFSEFDRIMADHRIEKIKTIGDSYMAAGGLPTANSTHASDAIKATFEMRDFIEKGKAKKIEKGLPYFEIRIGIHTGPVVAGIVGVKKFQYDIWGDTVNTASRMETSGEVGKVNISEATYDLVKDDSDLTFISRGKIKAKGKGEVEMYFVEVG